MQNGESDRVKAISNRYIEEQLDFDKRMIQYCYETIKPKFIAL